MSEEGKAAEEASEIEEEEEDEPVRGPWSNKKGMHSLKVTILTRRLSFNPSMTL